MTLAATDQRVFGPRIAPLGIPASVEKMDLQRGEATQNSQRRVTDLRRSPQSPCSNRPVLWAAPQQESLAMVRRSFIRSVSISVGRLPPRGLSKVAKT